MKIWTRVILLLAWLAGVCLLAVLGQKWSQLTRSGENATAQFIMSGLLGAVVIAAYPLITRGGKMLVESEKYETVVFRLHGAKAVKAAHRFVLFGQCLLLLGLGVAWMRLLALVS